MAKQEVTFLTASTRLGQGLLRVVAGARAVVDGVVGRLFTTLTDAEDAEGERGFDRRKGAVAWSGGGPFAVGE